MARSKEQWKAQQRAQHTQTKSNAFFQMKRPGVAHPTGARPQALPATSAVFQLGRPTSAAAAAAVRPAVMKPDPGQTPGLLRTSASGQTACIDLTLDDEDEEEDEPMGTQLQPPAARTPAATAAATAPAAPAIATATAIPAPPPAAATISAASDGVKLRMLDGGSAPIVMALPLERSESASELMVPLAEDVESDVDEEWPSVPLSVNEQSPAGQKEEEVKAALDAIRKTIPLSEERQGQNVAQRIAPTKSIAQTGALPLNANDDDEMEVDVDEELPSRATEGGDSPTTVNRIVRVENLEDGEIFEEGAAPKPAIEVQRAVMLEQETDAHPVDAMEIRPHLRNKKQKKRGKKKTKRKLEAMQMMDAPAGDMPPDFQRMTRQCPFGDAPPPGPYTYALMRNGPRGDPVNVRPVFQDPTSAPFHPGRMFVGVPHPPMRPPLPQLPAPSMPPPPYDDSQILRVNRQGNMEMLDNEAQMQIHAMFSKPPRHGGFNYRSVSMSPPRPVRNEPSHLLQRSVSDASRLPPRPASGRDVSLNVAANEGRGDSDDLDLDSLRAAALRSKTKRPAKNPTPTTPKTTELQSTSSSSPSSPIPEQKQSESTSPEIDKLRLEILRSMQRNRKRTANKGADIALSSTSPAAQTTANGQSGQRTCETAKHRKEGGNVGVDKSPAAEANGSAANKLPQPTLKKISGPAQVEGAPNDGSSCETDRSTTLSELNESSDKGETPSTDCTKVRAEVPVTTPEFRPLTACSQSLVIRLSPEDFSPRKGGNDARAMMAASSGVHDAIKEMRRRIAEREKAQTNCLLESAAAKLSNPSSEQGSSPSPVSPSPSPPDMQSAVKEKNAGVSQRSDSTTAKLEENSLPTTKSKEAQAAIATAEPGTKATTNGNAKQAELAETNKNMAKQGLLSEARLPVEPVAGRDLLSSTPEESREPALESQKRNKSGVSTFVDVHVLPPALQHQVPASSDRLNGDPASEPCGVSTSTVTGGSSKATSCKNQTTKKAASASPSTPGSDDELDFCAIRAEYEQCVSECEEADVQIARLSREMALLEKELQPIESTVGEA